MRRSIAALVTGLMFVWAGSASASDPAGVTSDPDAQQVGVDLGISAEDAATRLVQRPRLSAAIAYIDAHPSAFSGAYFDGSGTFVIEVPESSTDRAADVMVLIPAGIRFRVDGVKHSLSELQIVRDELMEEFPEFEALGTRVSSLSIDKRANIVRLILNGPVDSVRDRVSAAFGSLAQVEYGPMPTPQTCTNQDSCTPWRGGITIIRSIGGGVNEYCTYGYNARANSGSAIKMITAGHCGNGTWRHNGTVVGTTDLNNLSTGGHWYGDFQRVPTSFSGTKNLIYVDDSEKGRAITGINTYSQQINGDIACHTGIATRHSCGYIVNDDLQYCQNWNGANVCSWGKLVSYAQANGDSGGPVYYGYDALGIHWGYIGSNGVYSTIDNAEAALAVLTCLNASCT